MRVSGVPPGDTAPRIVPVETAKPIQPPAGELADSSAADTHTLAALKTPRPAAQVGGTPKMTANGAVAEPR